MYHIRILYTASVSERSSIAAPKRWWLGTGKDEGRYTNNVFVSAYLATRSKREIKFLTTCSRVYISFGSSHTHRDFLLNHLFVIPSDIIDPRFSATNTPTCIVPPTCGKHEKLTFTASTQNTLSRNPAFTVTVRCAEDEESITLNFKLMRINVEIYLLCEIKGSPCSLTFLPLSIETKAQNAPCIEIEDWPNRRTIVERSARLLNAL